jgi:hypothetical protein
MRVRGRRSTTALLVLALVGLCVCPSPASAANLPGQSFNITNLPNGWYYARLEVNPLGALYETTTTNNAVPDCFTWADGLAASPCSSRLGTGSSTRPPNRHR